MSKDFAAFDLPSTTGTVLGFEELQSHVDEAAVASALRKISCDISDVCDRQFLQAVADALDHSEAPLRLRLSRQKKGRPKDGEMITECLWIGQYIDEQVRLGVKQEAAIQAVMAAAPLSRSKVIRLLSLYRRELRSTLQSLQHFAKERGR